MEAGLGLSAIKFWTADVDCLFLMFLRLQTMIMAKIATAIPQTTPTAIPMIRVTLGPGLTSILELSLLESLVPVDCDAVAVVVCVERVVCTGTFSWNVSVAAGTSVGSEEAMGVLSAVVVGSVEVVATWVGSGVAVLSGMADDWELEPGTTKVESVTEMSNGGLYSKVFVKSSMTLKPYLSPWGMVPLS